MAVTAPLLRVHIWSTDAGPNAGWSQGQRLWLPPPSKAEPVLPAAGRPASFLRLGMTLPAQPEDPSGGWKGTCSPPAWHDAEHSTPSTSSSPAGLSTAEPIQQPFHPRRLSLTQSQHEASLENPPSAAPDAQPPEPTHLWELILDLS